MSKYCTMTKSAIDAQILDSRTLPFVTVLYDEPNYTGHSISLKMAETIFHKSINLSYNRNVSTHKNKHIEKQL